MRILGIETSCDDTGVAIYDKNNGLLSNQLYSQVKTHASYGGIVPELAARDHIRKVVPLIKMSLKQAGLKKSNIDGIAYTAGPGLISSLIVGATIGCSLAYSLCIPAIAIHHMEGHLLTTMMLEKNTPIFPFVALLISGGHTQIISVTNIGEYCLLGETIDDSVGETFDKIARIMGLGYPGGFALSNLAKSGVSGSYFFPRPMTDKPGLSLSFSGLKTFVANTIYTSSSDFQTRANIARSFEDAVIDTLIIKCKRALDLTGFKQLVIAGGVSANHSLRISLKNMMHQRGGKIFYARPEFCTDNGAMIAYVGMLRLQKIMKINLNIKVKRRWSLEELSPLVS